MAIAISPPHLTLARRAHPTLGHMLVTDLKISEAARQDIAIELRVRPGARHRADIDDELNLHRA